MAEENVAFAYKNFCINPLSGIFSSIDTTNATSVLISKNSSGNVVGTSYSLVPSFDVGINIDALVYTGPINLSSTSQIQDGLPFFTLYDGIITKWELSDSTAELIAVSNSSDFSSNNYTMMAIERYSTEFADDTTSGTGVIEVGLSDNISVGDELLLGPSTDNDSLNEYEYVGVTAVSGTDVYIQTLSSGVATINEYLDGDAITFAKFIYLFSSDGYVDKRNVDDFSLEERTYNEIYSSVTAADWCDIYQSITFVRSSGTNLLHIDPYTDYQILKSHTLTTTKADKVSKWPIYALAFDSLSMYRLQSGKTLVDDSGDFIDYSWSSYNYHEDTVEVYTKNITVQPDPSAVLTNDYDTTTLRAIVRDQYGVGLLSQLIYFEKVSGDTGGYFTPINGQAYTNSSGIAEITYTTGYYAPTDSDDDFEEIIISAKTDGASTLTGSQYVWDNVYLKLNKRLDSIIYLDQIDDEVESILYLDQIDDNFSSELYLDSFSTFSSYKRFEQISDFESEFLFDQTAPDLSVEAPVDQVLEESDEVVISQLYISRHRTSGHIDTATIDQFQFVEDAIPAFWSEKNDVGTDIWIRLRPYAFSLNQSSLIFKVKEISHAGDTGWVDVTSLCEITTFDAGGGLLGLDILYSPSSDFHYAGMVYVSISVYDNATIPNIIFTDYWFRIIPDYKAPYIENESPDREEEDVSINSDVSFDIIDIGVGVDLDTLEVYINNRRKYDITTTAISNGYHVGYINSDGFHYGQDVEVSVKVRDASPYANVLYDTWRFYVAGSTGPWIDPDSFYPRNCSRGIPRKWAGISVNIYGIDDTGVDPNSIIINIGGSTRDVSITPIILRLN